jgi:signal transduction histidine kinase
MTVRPARVAGAVSTLSGSSGFGDRRAAGLSTVVVACIALGACGRPDDPAIVHVREARCALAASALPPPDGDAAWRAVRLPDRWDVARRRQGTEGWYRAEVVLDRMPDALWAIYLPHVVMNAQALVNGRVVGDGGRLEAPTARNWNRPLLFTIPTGSLVAGRNTIDVRLVHTGSPALLGAFDVGPAAALRPTADRMIFWGVTLPTALAVMAVATALLVGLVLLPGEPAGPRGAAWTMAALLLWAWSTASDAIRDIPFATGAWEWLDAVTQNAVVPCFVAGMHRFLGLSRPRVEWALLLVWVAGAGVLAAAPRVYFFALFVAWTSFTLVLAGYLFVLVRGAARRGSDVSTLLLVPLGLTILFGVHDAVVVTTGYGAGTYLTLYLLPAVVVTFGWETLARLRRGLRESERLTRDLETRVARKHAELEESYQRVRALERDQAVAEERVRLTRDIHDGLGGHLVSTLAMVESGDEFSRADVADALRGALDDLRLVIDSLDPAEDDLSTVLASVRARLAPRLERRGMRVDWQMVDLPPVTGLGPERLMHVLRIVQEAITNVVKHARAHGIQVRTAEETDGDGRRGVAILVSDDGCGFDPGRTEGRGLVNMRRRAAELGGALAVETGAAGTRLRLWLPVA